MNTRFDTAADDATRVSRERVIEAIYETVLRPDQFGAFLDVWREHMQAALDAYDGAAALSEAEESFQGDTGLDTHFQRAYSILEQFGRPHSRQSTVDAVKAASVFSMLLRPDGGAVAASAATRAFLGENPTLEALVNRLNVPSADLLQQVLTNARAGSDPFPGAVLITDATPRHLIVRVIEAQGDRPLINVEALDFVWTARAEGVLTSSFGLSPAEVDVVRNLLAGYTLKDIAAASGRSEHTVRNQAKSVLAKTGAPGQTDLIRLVAYLLNQDAGRARVRRTETGVAREILRMRTGLNMQVYRAGPRDGHPVLFINGILDGSAPIRFVQDQVHARNLQIIAPIRPGFGGSDPAPSSGQMAETFLDHLHELMDVLKLTRPVLVGHMSGCVFAQILSCCCRDRVAGLVAVAGGMPVQRLRQVHRMAPRQRAVFYTARYTPKLLPAVLRAGIAQLDSGDAEAFMTGLYREGTHDLSVIRERRLNNLIQSGFRETVEQGHRGFADEVMFLVRDWSSHIATPGAPTLVLHGTKDPVIDARDIQAVMGARAGTRVRILPGAGQLILYEYPEMVLDEVAALLA